MNCLTSISRRNCLRSLALAAAVPLLHGGSVAVAADLREAAGQNQSQTHKILSCNIRVPLAEDEAQGDGWDARKELCLSTIESQRPDVICLQECRAVQYEAFRLRFADFASYGLANPGDEFDPGNVIFYSRDLYELVTCGGFWLSETPHIAGSSSWDSARSRFANWVQLRVRDTGQELRVWNTHLDHVGQEAREQGARMLVEASETLPDDLPQVLTGDMNAGATNHAIEIFKEGGWDDTYARVHGPEDPGFTFHGFLGPKRAEKLGKKRGSKIDWIFTRGKLTTTAGEIIRHGHNGRYPSDHYFVSATIATGE